MANWDPTTVTPTLVQAPSMFSGSGQPGSGLLSQAGGVTVQPHHSLIGIVLLAVLVLFLLNKAGFRFAVTVGRS